jgi:prophage regulatory protein
MSSTAMRRMPGIQSESGHPRSTLYRYQKLGLWPAFVKLGTRSVGQPAYEIAALNTARAAGWSDDLIRQLVVRLEEIRLDPSFDASNISIADLVQVTPAPTKPRATAPGPAQVPA